MSLRTSSIWRCLVIVLLGSIGCSTRIPAALQGLDRPITLGPDQGALVVEVESNLDVVSLEIRSLERTGSRVTLKKLAQGRHVHLLVMQAGRYRWSEVQMAGITYRGRDYPTIWTLEPSDDHLHFGVRAGVVSYPGVLVLDRKGNLLRAYTLNRSAQLIETIRQKKSAILSRYPLAYSGRGRDDFLEFYTTKLIQHDQVGGVDAQPADESN